MKEVSGSKKSSRRNPQNSCGDLECTVSTRTCVGSTRCSSVLCLLHFRWGGDPPQTATKEKYRSHVCVFFKPSVFTSSKVLTKPKTFELEIHKAKFRSHYSTLSCDM